MALAVSKNQVRSPGSGDLRTLCRIFPRFTPLAKTVDEFNLKRSKTAF
jgi:hypothetical protein